MRRITENQDLRSLERELRSQRFRHYLAIKDGALDCIVAEVISRIADLEDKIEKLKRLPGTPVEYSPKEDLKTHRHPRRVQVH